jgi:hypothetical protein
MNGNNLYAVGINKENTLDKQSLMKILFNFIFQSNKIQPIIKKSAT